MGVSLGIFRNVHWVLKRKNSIQFFFQLTLFHEKNMYKSSDELVRPMNK